MVSYAVIPKESSLSSVTLLTHLENCTSDIVESF